VGLETSRNGAGDGKGLTSSHRRRHALQAAIALVFLVLTTLPLRPVGDWEIAFFRAINGLPDLLFPPVWLIMQAGSLIAVLLISVVALVAGRLRQGLDLAVAGVSAWFLATVVKELVGRSRPANILQDVVLRGAPHNGHGYVSGHAAVAAALAAVLSPYLSRNWRFVAWLIAVLVALARVYVGAHLPLDVLGGLAVGWAMGSIVHVLLGEPQSRLGGNADSPG
jgi:glycosyltransferase 2 family protein